MTRQQRHHELRHLRLLSVSQVGVLSFFIQTIQQASITDQQPCQSRAEMKADADEGESVGARQMGGEGKTGTQRQCNTRNTFTPITPILATIYSPSNVYPVVDF